MTAAMAPTEKTGSGLPALLRLSGPVVASRLGIMAMGLVDTIVVGRYSSAELGYHALAWAVTGVVLTTALGLLSGVQVMTSQAIGSECSAASHIQWFRRESPGRHPNARKAMALQGTLH